MILGLLIVLLVILNAADCYTTMRFLELGGRERFWLLRTAIEKFGVEKALFGKLMLVPLAALPLLFLPPHPLLDICMAVVDLFYVYWVVSNALLIQRLN